MLIEAKPKNLEFFSALASPVRMEILNLLAQGDLNIKELAARVGISSPIMLKHIKKLEDAGIVQTTLVNRNGSQNKMCSLLVAEYLLLLPRKSQYPCSYYDVDLPVGYYADIEARPSCGLADREAIIGKYLDDPRFLWSNERTQAQLLWFWDGYVEYRFPNLVSRTEKPLELEASFEICSEAPGFNDEWPSDIFFTVNGVSVGSWISPGDYGKKRGIFTPEWWPGNQYGLLKTLHINEKGSFIDDIRISDITIAEVSRPEWPDWKLRFATKPREHTGGLTLFGEAYGNYAQNIRVRIFYTDA